MKTGKYTFIETDIIPDLIQEGTVYVANGYSCAGLKCPCGCNEDIFLRINSDQHPSWDVKDNSIKPSILRLTGCKSHFYITNGITIKA